VSARVQAVAASRAASEKFRDLGAARIARWLLTGPAQQSDGPHAGAVGGWIGTDGRAGYVYPEITGYYLQWLAWMTRRHGRQPLYVARAEAAVGWLTQWLADERPPTRIYVVSRDDWRNDALFTFDLAMVLRGIGAAAKTGLITTPAKVVDRTCSELARIIGSDGQFEACIRHRGDENFPERWSTRRGPFLAKAAAGILDAGQTLPNIPAALLSAARQTFDASLDALARAPHDETHPFLYAVEGFLARPDDRAFTARLPKIAAHFDALVARGRSSGRIPEAKSSDGLFRLDIVAQTIRAGLLLDAHRRDRISRRSECVPPRSPLRGFAAPGGGAIRALGAARRRELDSLADTLAQYVSADGALPFSPDALDVQFNVWTALFAEQALALVYREPREIARIAASPSIV